MGAAWVALGGVVLAGILSFFTARLTANKALVGVVATLEAKRSELDQNYVLPAVDMITSGTPAKADAGVAILRALWSAGKLSDQDRVVVKAVLDDHARRQLP